MTLRAVVMSGGGSKGAFQVGALHHLVHEKKLDFQVIAGVSTGALTAAMVAQGNSFEELGQRVEDVRQLYLGLQSYKDIYTKRFLGKLLVFFAKNSLHDPDPIKKKIHAQIDPLRLQKSGRELAVGSVCLERGTYRSANQNEPHVLDFTLASASMPLMFPPVSIEGEAWVDGGVRNVTPMQDAFRALKRLQEKSGGNQDLEMYVLLASPLGINPDKETWSSGLKIGFRTVSILVNEIFREDLEYALAINQSTRAYVTLEKDLGQLPGGDGLLDILREAHFEYCPPKYREVKIWTVVPDREYSESLEFDPGKIRAAIAAGSLAAQAPLNEEDLQKLLESA